MNRLFRFNTIELLLPVFRLSGLSILRGLEQFSFVLEKPEIFLGSGTPGHFFLFEIWCHDVFSISLFH